MLLLLITTNNGSVFVIIWVVVLGFVFIWVFFIIDVPKVASSVVTVGGVFVVVKVIFVTSVVVVGIVEATLDINFILVVVDGIVLFCDVVMVVVAIGVVPVGDFDVAETKAVVEKTFDDIEVVVGATDTWDTNGDSDIEVAIDVDVEVNEDESIVEEVIDDAVDDSELTSIDKSDDFSGVVTVRKKTGVANVDVIIAVVGAEFAFKIETIKTNKTMIRIFLLSCILFK